MSKNNLYDAVIKNGYDVGSGALAVADENIKMELNEYGEYVSAPPKGKHSSFDNTKLSLISAMTNESLNESELAKSIYADVPDIKYNKTIGYYLSLYAGHVVEGDYRKNASSGGFGTWIVKELLESKLIDGVIHVKETEDGDDILFKYDVSTNLQQVKDGAKSRYYPAEFSEAINKIKKMDGKYAIVGIPSIIMEFRLLALQDKEVAKKIVFTIGLICGHQKSTKYAESLAWECGIKPGDLEKIDFRKKAPNRPAYDYDTELIGKINGKTTKISKRTKDLFVSNWGQGMFKVKLSDFTDDALNETADISLGDAWLPRYVQDWKGTNIVIIRHPLLKKIFEEGQKSDLIDIDPLEEKDIIASQSGLIHHTQDELPYRIKIVAKNNKWVPKKRYVRGKISFLKKIVQKIRLEIYSHSRAAYKDAIKKNDWGHFVRQMSPLQKRYRNIYLLIKVKALTPKKAWTKLMKRFKALSSVKSQ